MVLVRLAIVLLGAALVQPALSESSHQEQVAAALSALDAADMEGSWRYMMTVQAEGEVREISHDPTRGGYEVRQLVSVDDAAPSESQLEKFYKEEKKRVDERDPETATFSYLVNLDTLALAQVEGDLYLYRYSPRVRQFEDMAHLLDGDLTFNARTGAIVSIGISNTAELEPAFSVSVATYRLAFHFFAGENDIRLPSNMSSVVSGKAGFFKQFDTAVHVAFSDYERVASSQSVSR